MLTYLIKLWITLKDLKAYNTLCKQTKPTTRSRTKTILNPGTYLYGLYSGVFSAIFSPSLLAHSLTSFFLQKISGKKWFGIPRYGTKWKQLIKIKFVLIFRIRKLFLLHKASNSVATALRMNVSPSLAPHKIFARFLQQLGGTHVGRETVTLRCFVKGLFVTNF